MEISPALKLSFFLISLSFPWIDADNSTTSLVYSNTSLSTTSLVYSNTSSPTTSLVYSNTSLSEGGNNARPGCPTKCGNLTVPFPFGIGVNSGCSLNRFFDIHCNTSFDPPKAFLTSDDLEVVRITETKIHVSNRVALSCYDQEGSPAGNADSVMDLSGTPFSISNENKLTVVGCDDIAFMRGGADEFSPYVSSCVAMCSKTQDLGDDFCSGIGCCQASIPKGLKWFSTSMTTLSSHERVYSFNRCGYSFLAEQNSYRFNISDVSDQSFVDWTLENVPLAIDWAIGTKTCDQMRNGRAAICQGASVCVDSGIGGYRCNCSAGYHGNPYLSPGCQDIDECKFNPCHPKAECRNTPGSYSCSCFPTYIGDGMNYESGCIPVPPPTRTTLYAGLLVGAGLFLITAVAFWSYKILKKRRIKQLKQMFFKRNGGLMLQQQLMSSHDSVLDKMKIFTLKELERATDRFNESRILGRGGQGTVYKGMLSDGRIVAVKKSKQVDENQLVEFINEIVILSQINHRNVVKVLGCCLETEVPLLVYEFVPNGTLYELIQDDSTGFPFSWDLRLRVAAEIANALAYLHYATSVPIYHRDMKSNNILLDEKYRAKLSDFGISRSVAIDQTHVTTMVKGTFGYLDPEYFQTGKFTEKSDVYSFGVILVELLTGQKAISTSKAEEERSLVTRFLLIMKEDSLKTILDCQITEQGINEEHVVVANLAKRCLNLNGKKRPTIREVAMELESIRTCENPSYVGSMNEDMFFMETEMFMVEDDDPSSSTGTICLEVVTR